MKALWRSVGPTCVRVQARLGIATDGEEEGIDGGETTEGVEDDEGEQTAARNVDICSRISFYLPRSARKAILAPGGHLTMPCNEAEVEVGANLCEHRLCLSQSQYGSHVHGVEEMMNG